MTSVCNALIASKPVRFFGFLADCRQPGHYHPFWGNFRVDGYSVMWIISGLPITRQLSQRRFCRNAGVVPLLSTNEGNFVDGCRARLLEHL
jgi:hypothetical protein